MRVNVYILVNVYYAARTLLGAKGIATRSKDATRGSLPSLLVTFLATSNKKVRSGQSMPDGACSRCGERVGSLAKVSAVEPKT